MKINPPRRTRSTPIRDALLLILKTATEPKTPMGLLLALKKRMITVNKTTVYRQLETLKANGIVSEVQFHDRTKRYELKGGSHHHHHLVCISCGAIQDVAFPRDLAPHEERIAREHEFTILNHSLEFFGLCKRCIEKKSS